MAAAIGSGALVDASGSVSETEFDLQAQGLAGAVRDPDVVAARRMKHIAPFR
jgi:hypothetical protein